MRGFGTNCFPLSLQEIHSATCSLGEGFGINSFLLSLQEIHSATFQSQFSVAVYSLRILYSTVVNTIQFTISLLLILYSLFI